MTNEDEKYQCIGCRCEILLSEEQAHQKKSHYWELVESFVSATKRCPFWPHTPDSGIQMSIRTYRYLQLEHFLLFEQ